MDTNYDWIGFLIASVLALTSVVVLGERWTRLWPLWLLLAAVTMRLVGSVVRYEILFDFYRGSGDAVRYFTDSLPVADALRNFETSVFDSRFWMQQGHRWGTGFIVSTSSLVVAVLGASLRGEFVVFSMISFAGLGMLALAFARVQYDRRVIYAQWLWFFPSLWFWPASVGKESVLLLAVGLATLGYVGNSRGIRWGYLAAGTGLAFMVRPHVAAVLGLSVLVAEWFRTWKAVSGRRVAESLGLVLLSVGLLMGMNSQFGIQRPDLDSLTDMMIWQRMQTSQGGSGVGVVPFSIAGVPLAFVNTWMRPFPWEAHNITALFASLEILAFWVLVLWRRREVWIALRNWRQHRLLRFALPLLVGYTLMIGLTFGNLGIIARQRTLILPFMLLFLVAVPRESRSPGREAVSPRGAATSSAR